MALRNILKENDPGLVKKSRVVKDFNKRLHILLDDMRETMLFANGLGLAAPQVGVLRRVALVVEVPEMTDCESIDELDDDVCEPAGADGTEEAGGQEGFGGDDIEDGEPCVIEMINPELVYQDGGQTGSEGCLSFPGVFGMVTRPQTVKVKAQDRYGEEFEMEVSGMTARAVCHEIDHLNGVLFVDLAERMLSDEELEEMRKNR